MKQSDPAAVISAVVTSRTGDATDAEAMLDRFRPGIAVATGIGLLGLLVTATGWVSERRQSRVADPADRTSGSVDDRFALAAAQD